jgi:hypothetical protein
VDLVDAEIRAQLAILKKTFDFDEKFIICSNLHSHMKSRIKNVHGDQDELCVPNWD